MTQSLFLLLENIWVSLYKKFPLLTEKLLVNQEQKNNYQITTIALYAIVGLKPRQLGNSEFIPTARKYLSVSVEKISSSHRKIISK